MSDKNLRSPDERLFAAEKDTTKDELSSSKNKQKPDSNRPKGEIAAGDDADDEKDSD